MIDLSKYACSFEFINGLSNNEWYESIKSTILLYRSKVRLENASYLVSLSSNITCFSNIWIPKPEAKNGNNIASSDCPSTWSANTRRFLKFRFKTSILDIPENSRDVGYPWYPNSNKISRGFRVLFMRSNICPISSILCAAIFNITIVSDKSTVSSAVNTS